MRFHSPYFPLSLLQQKIDLRKRALDEAGAAGLTLPLSVYDTEMPDARVQDERKRGNYRHYRYGQMSWMFCTCKCGCAKRSPYIVSETFVKVFYRCTRCVLEHGEPVGAVKISGAGAP